MPNEDKHSPPNIGEGEEVDKSQDLLGLGEDIDRNSQEQGSDTTGKEALDQLLKEKGISDEQALVETFRNYEKEITKLKQDVKRMSMGPLPEQTQYPPPIMPPKEDGTVDFQDIVPEDPSEIMYDKEKFLGFLGNLKKNFDKAVETKIREKEKAEAYAEVNSYRQRNPEKYNKLRGLAHELSYHYPRANVEQLFELAEEEYKKRLGVLREDMGLSDSQLKTLNARATQRGQIGGRDSSPLGGTDSEESRKKKIVQEILSAGRLDD